MDTKSLALKLLEKVAGRPLTEKEIDENLDYVAGVIEQRGYIGACLIFGVKQ